MIREEMTGRLANNRFVTFPALYLNSDAGGTIKLGALTRKLKESWQGTEHPSSEKLAALAVAVFAILKAGHPDSLALFNRMLESIVSVDVSHFAVFLGHGEEGDPAEFDGFRFGAVQNLSLQYRSARAHSDYFTIHGKRLHNRWCMESPIYRRSVIGFLDLYWEAPSRKNISDEIFFQTLLSYYEEITGLYAEQMWQDLDDRQVIAAAAGIEVFGVPDLKRATGLAMISVYLNQTNHHWDGYVVPTEQGFQMNTWIGNPPILQKLKDFQAGLPLPLSPTLAQVARYGVRARRAAARNDLAEALLSFTIALEMLFSEKNQTSQAVSRRFAVVASDPTPDAFTTHRREILSLYDSRSQYVHAGIAPTQAAVDTMTTLFEEALAVLIRLEKRQVLRDKEQFNRWIKLLDWIASGYEAGQIPGNDVLNQAGLRVPSEEVDS
jgi:hypothetical protein